MKATATAHSNLALVKYWGKQNSALNIPAVGSISITLEGLATHTTVQFDPDFEKDVLILNGVRADEEKEKRISAFLDLVRRQANINYNASVTSENNYPTGAGLASSASGFAALALAAAGAAHLSFSPQQLSVLARQGSGSAARSIFGGFVEMKAGSKSDGSDSHAVQLADETHWGINVIIAITTDQEKQIGSTEGMTQTALTSPFYADWISSSKQDLEEMRTSIAAKDFEKLGEISEHSCLKMHGLAMSSKPGIVYWNATTISIIHFVRELRQKNFQCYFSIDAGPQLKIICLPHNAEKIENFVNEIPGVKRMIRTSLGSGAKLIEKES
jgi:diphosphomevalonate decarboxylase